VSAPEATSAGLVPSAISAHGPADVISPSFDVDSLYRPNFPSVELVGFAAAELPALPSAPAGPDVELREGPTWRITLSGGTVQVGTVDYARGDRSTERRAEADRKVIDARVALTVPWEDIDPVPPRAPARGRVTSWTSKSRARMIKTLSDLDWAPFFAQGGIPAMMTLTLPGDWLSVFPTSEDATAAMRVLHLRFKRSWGRPLIGPWKREFQRRGAWHLHGLIVPPRGLSDGRYAHGGLLFRDWLSRTWTDVLDIEDAAERAKSLAAGTAINYADGLRSTDPRRIAVYFTGHGLEKDKEYQNVPPVAWVEAGGVGRWWGVWGLKPYRTIVEVAPADAVIMARTMRRWSRARGYFRKTKRLRVELATGRVRERASTRRVCQVRRGRGWVSLNDAPAFVSQVAPLLGLESFSGCPRCAGVQGSAHTGAGHMITRGDGDG
jgi:hypothetical protein